VGDDSVGLTLRIHIRGVNSPAHAFIVHIHRLTPLPRGRCARTHAATRTEHALCTDADRAAGSTAHFTHIMPFNTVYHDATRRPAPPTGTRASRPHLPFSAPPHPTSHFATRLPTTPSARMNASRHLAHFRHIPLQRGTRTRNTRARQRCAQPADGSAGVG